MPRLLQRWPYAGARLAESRLLSRRALWRCSGVIEARFAAIDIAQMAYVTIELHIVAASGLGIVHRAGWLRT